MFKCISTACLSAILLIGAACTPLLQTGSAKAADWGYDDQQSQQVHPLRATALPLSKTMPSHPVPGGKTAGKPVAGTAAGKTAATAHSGTIDTQSLIEECWIDIYELAGGSKLDSEQRAATRAIVLAKLNGTAAQHQDVRSALTFLPKLKAYLVVHPEQAPNYSALLKALLRWKGRNESGVIDATQPDAVASDECTLIAQVLGPQRLSVPGQVPFSEDAVNAYADMACFIYEQENPGKSVDALDNRAVFATVLSQKFREAPTRKDKEAMAAFDLSWAKFKIVWTEANESQRVALVQSLKKSGANAAWAQVKDSMLELVLNNWPLNAPKPSVAGMPVVSNATASQRK